MSSSAYMMYKTNVAKIYQTLEPLTVYANFSRSVVRGLGRLEVRWSYWYVSSAKS